MTMADKYLMGAATSELDRMLFQGEMFRPEAERLLDRCGPGPGGRAVDIGCGPLGILDMLSERVGPGGEVVGLDVQPEMLDLARRLVTERALDNVRLVEGDAAAAPEERGAFDFVHTRLVLMNVPHSTDVLSAMVALARPGGTVAVQDVDWVSRVCDPPHPAWTGLVDLIAELWRLSGMDVHLGRRLPRLLRGAGLTDIGVDAGIRVFQHDHPYQTLLVDRAELCRDALVERGLTGHAELDRLTGELRDHLARPDTVVVHPILFQAWGRVPGGPAAKALPQG
ncbi:methyltransferase domain-containing protein [Streptomyces sp. CB00455]|uniref:methyltransferase domain-containing protein n=1 Tax=Streptomyces sp. CB00455 TaxID=1703927 RepID=UPI000A5BC860|nr:methyltransferase domain-containing protein [Streptomyces sp. CB00455]